MKALESHTWKITFKIEEDDDCCDITAHLTAGDRALSGFGRARRNPSDPLVPQIGEELATARALQDLAHHLIDDVQQMIEQFDPDAGSNAG